MTRLSYDVVGQGEPLLLLPGYAVPASSLDIVAAALAERFTVITLDYPGSGSAPAAWLPLTIPSLAARAVRVLDELGHPSAHVFGLSLGGLVAQEMAIRFPERVRHLVLGATTSGGARAPRIDPWTFTSAMSAISSHPQVRGSVRASGVVAQGLAASLHDASGRLDRIQADTLVVHGERDRLVPPGNARLLRDGIPSSTLVMVPGGSHFFAFEIPEVLAGIVLEWLGSGSAEPGRRSEVCRRVEPLDRAAALPVGLARAWVTTGRLALALGARGAVATLARAD